MGLSLTVVLTCVLASLATVGCYPERRRSPPPYCRKSPLMTVLPSGHSNRCLLYIAQARAVSYYIHMTPRCLSYAAYF